MIKKYIFDVIITLVNGERYVVEDYMQLGRSKDSIAEAICSTGVYTDEIGITPQGIATVELKKVRECNTEKSNLTS